MKLFRAIPVLNAFKMVQLVSEIKALAWANTDENQIFAALWRIAVIALYNFSSV